MKSESLKHPAKSRRPVIYRSAGAFLEKTREGLERREAENSLLLGIASMLAGDPSPGKEAPFLATVDGRDGWDLAALMTPPFPLSLVSADGAATPEAALSALTDYLKAGAIPVSGVVARVPLAEAFAAVWTRATGHAIRRTVRQRVHRLARVAPLPPRSGRLRPAVRADLDFVGKWMGAFQAEALQDDNHNEAFRVAERRLEAGDLFVWDDAGPRSMAARSRPTRNTISVNAVYTPPEWRNQGLATATVAALSQRLLEDGYAMCVLFTNLENPISNRIYARIGYEAVCDFAHIYFESGSRS